MSDSNGSGDKARGSGEFERFEALLKKLVHVPKAELDKQRGKGKKQAGAA